MNQQKGFITIVVLIGIIVLSIASGYLFLASQNIIPFKKNPIPLACTEEAKQCPDGSYVSRTGLKCEFTACPNEKPTTVQIILKEGQKEGPLLVQKIYSNYMTGLSFREYPVAVDQGQAITLYIGNSVSNGCTINLKLISIQGNTATFIKEVDDTKPCPICLAENTLIDTPLGQIPVQNLKEGMPIWTVNISGNKIFAIIIKTSKVSVPSNHQVIHIVLDDKREIFASPLHPVGDGRSFKDLHVNDFLDGNRIVTAEKVPYNKNYTFDILPSGPTGLYWANGILIDSTLH